MGKRMSKMRITRVMTVAVVLSMTATLLSACSGTQEERGEREGGRVREDLRGFRDFLHDRGVLIDTRLPER